MVQPSTETNFTKHLMCNLVAGGERQLCQIPAGYFFPNPDRPTLVSLSRDPQSCPKLKLFEKELLAKFRLFSLGVLGRLYTFSAGDQGESGAGSGASKFATLQPSQVRRTLQEQEKTQIRRGFGQAYGLFCSWLLGGR